MDAIEEFRVITSNPSAEFSRNSGFQVAMTTKSGTNEYHGSFYNFHRNTVLNANTFFNNASGVGREPLLRNQFGTTFGGPVKIPELFNGENRTFFFFNFEGGRTSQFATVTRTVYTQEAPQGIFRAITRNTTVNPETGRTLSRNSGAVLDPVTGTIQAILALTPLPNDFSSLFNGGSSNSEGRDGLNLAAYRFNAPGNEDANLQTYKVDHLLNDKQTLSVRVNWGNVDRDKGDFVNNVFEPFPGIPNRARLEKQRSGSLNWIASLSPSVTNEFRIGISRNQRTFTSTENVAGAISINAPGTDPYRRDNGLDFPRQTFQVTDNLTWAKGNHSMKMGFTVQTTILNRNAGANAIDINASPFNSGVSVSLTTCAVAATVQSPAMTGTGLVVASTS